MAGFPEESKPLASGAVVDWREFDHFHGNFTMNLAFSKFPKFQVFFENST